MKDILLGLRFRVGERLARLRASTGERRLRRAEVNRAIEQVLDQVNPRLRAVGGYRKRLFPVVDAVLTYADELAATVPGPVPIDRQSWMKNPSVNALFGSVDRLRRVLTGPAVRKFVKAHPGGTDYFAVLASMPDIRSQLGMELVGDAVQRDVQQTTVSFTDHEVALVGADETEVREQLAVAAREILVGAAAEEILEREAHIVELEDRLRILRIKIRALGAGSRGTALVTDGSAAHRKEMETLRERTAELEQDLSAARSGMKGLDGYLARLVERLREPKAHLCLREVKCRLDRMNVLREGGDDTDSREIHFHRIVRSGRPARVVQLIRFPRAELLEDGERLRDLGQYLH